MASSLINENVKLNIPIKYYGAIIGKNGVNMKRISEQYNVNVIFPNRATDQEDIIIYGIDQQTCLDAKQEILDLYDSQQARLRLQLARKERQQQWEERQKEKEKRKHEWEICQKEKK